MTAAWGWPQWVALAALILLMWLAAATALGVWIGKTARGRDQQIPSEDES